MVVDTLYLQLLGVIVPLVIAMLGVWQWRRDRAERLKITLHPWAAGVYPGTPALRDAIKLDVVNCGKVSVKLDQALLLTADGRQMVTPSSKGFTEFHQPSKPPLMLHPKESYMVMYWLDGFTVDTMRLLARIEVRTSLGKAFQVKVNGTRIAERIP